MLKNFRMTQIHTGVFYGLSYFVVEVRKVFLSCSYLYEAISCFEARIFDEVCQLQSQLMPQSVDTKQCLL